MGAILIQSRVVLGFEPATLGRGCAHHTPGQAAYRHVPLSWTQTPP